MFYGFYHSHVTITCESNVRLILCVVHEWQLGNTVYFVNNIKLSRILYNLSKDKLKKKAIKIYKLRLLRHTSLN